MELVNNSACFCTVCDDVMTFKTLNKTKTINTVESQNAVSYSIFSTSAQRQLGARGCGDIGDKYGDMP